VPPEVLGDILRGGADQALQAGVPILGGHTINDPELKYGLSVVGQVHPDRIVTNAGAKPGDLLVLTKPVGTGMLATALKKQLLDQSGTERIVEVMTTLNRDASERMLTRDVHACTDVTGFGLAGHAREMADASGVTVEIDSAAVPIIEGAVQAVADGHIPGGAHSNRKFIDDVLRVEDRIDENLLMLMFDPQTAGGLLIALPEADAQSLVDELRATTPEASIVGRCVKKQDATIVIR
jgi:selenide,water dikinase